MKKSGKTSRDEMAGLEARRLAVTSIEQVVRHGANLDEVFARQSASRTTERANEADMRLARAICLTTLRNRNRILKVLALAWDRKPPKRAHFLNFTLEAAAAQILFMGVPDSAAANLAVALIKNESATSRFSGFANAVLRRIAREKDDLLNRTEDSSPFPDWMEKRLRSDYGRNNLSAMGKAVLEQPYVDIRLKSGGSVRPEEAVTLPDGGYRLTSPAAIETLEGYEAGDWWVQDIAAAQAVRLMGDLKGKRVADLCAAPGGKTMQLASMGASVTAVDDSSARLARLAQNLTRTGLQAEIVETDILEWEPPEKFDAVLLDAPCTATGTMRRNPDILWNTNPEDVDKLVALQTLMIQRAHQWVKPGGIFVYANCSLFKAEGENLVSGLELPGFALERIAPEELPGLEPCVSGLGTFRALPHFLEAPQPASFGMDGFFIARYRHTCAD